jgi:hypothetical protein
MRRRRGEDDGDDEDDDDDDDDGGGGLVGDDASVCRTNSPALLTTLRRPARMCGGSGGGVPFFNMRRPGCWLQRQAALCVQLSIILHRKSQNIPNDRRPMGLEGDAADRPLLLPPPPPPHGRAAMRTMSTAANGSMSTAAKLIAHSSAPSSVRPSVHR